MSYFESVHVFPVFIDAVLTIWFSFQALFCSLADNPKLILPILGWHYGDVIMGAIASQITSLTIVYSTVYSDAD